MNILLGVSASCGVGKGKAFILPENQERKVPQTKISYADTSVQWARFETACEKACSEIEENLNALDEHDIQRVILETYKLMLTDPVFLDELHESLKQNRYNIEYILNVKMKEYSERLKNSGNDYLAERALDVEDVFGRVLDILLDFHQFNIEEVPDGAVIVAKSMKTSDAVILNKRKIAGIVLTKGGISSHVAILAKSYGIPAVVGIEDLIKNIQNSDTVIVDGDLGEVIVNPDKASIAELKVRIESEKKHQEELKKYKDKEGLTQDRQRVFLYANIGTPEEAELALEYGADGIGLFRTEFLFMDAMQKMNKGGASYKNTLNEDIQFEAYKKVLETMKDKPVTIRTLDAGGDKILYTSESSVTIEKNPLMGLRAIRLSLYNPQIFRTQLRALYRASVYGNLRILIPLVTDVSQVETVLGIARSVQLSLKEDNIPFNPDVPIGIMIETAAAAICADCLAPRAKFFSLGTNDLTQYTLGVDRENPAVAPLYNEFNLAVLRLIENTIRIANVHGIPVSICGEMAGSKESSIILIGMGIRSLSMAPKLIPEIKETISHFSMEELEKISKYSIS